MQFPLQIQSLIEKIRAKHMERWFTPAFFVVLGLKFFAASLFASPLMLQGFLPFVQYYYQSHFHDPYVFFVNSGALKAFPYAPGMLWLLVAPFILLGSVVPHALMGSVHFPLLLIHLPIIAADILLYTILCYLLPTRERMVLWLYWMSPILFYINYYHGQLDALPTVVLFVSLIALFKKRSFLAYFLLGVGIAIKTHLIIALPLYLITTYRKQANFWKVARYGALSLGVALMMMLPYITTAPFARMVFLTDEQLRLYNLAIPFHGRGLMLFAAPAALLVIVYVCATFKKITRDLFLLLLGLMYTAIIALAPPAPGWYYWSIPFLVYFFCKYERAPLLSFIGINFFYLAFMLSSLDSDIFTSLRPTFPAFALTPNPAHFFQSRGIDISTIENLFFTGLEVSVLMSALWTYRVGIASTTEYHDAGKPLMVGIAGDSGSGKSTLAGILTDLFGAGQTVSVNGDDVHKWPRGHEQWNVVTHLNPKANRLHANTHAAIALRNGRSITRVRYDHTTGTFTDPVQLKSNEVVIFEGLHQLFIEQMRTLFDLKIFLKPDEELRTAWVLERDTNKRGHRPEKVLDQLYARTVDGKKFIAPQEEFADISIEHTLSEDGLLVRFRIKNSFDLDPLTEAIAKIPGITKSEWTPDSNCTHSLFTTCGTASQNDLRNTAYRLVPNLEELLNNEPVWREGYHGIQQLCVLYLLSEIKKQS